jgi:hypothetical protein
VSGRLNLFQSSMLRWRALHPYNAVHVARVAAPLDAARLTAAIGAQLQAAGLTGLVLDARRRRYRWAGGPAQAPLALLAAGGDAAEVLSPEIERQLNAGFAASGPLDPFRFFARADGDGFRVGIAYDHWVAGGDSIALMLHGLIARYAGGTPRVPGDRYPAPYGRLLARHAGAYLRGLPAIRAIAADCRRGYRPRYADPADGRNGFVLAQVGAGAWQAATRTAKAWGATPNDLLLALLLDALSPLAAGRRGETRRTQLAVASILNLRRDFQPPATATFGQFLSSFRVSHAVPEGIGLGALARDVHDETERVKRKRLYLQTLTGIALGSVSWALQSPAQRSRVHAKNYPLWGGVTLLDADALWREAGEAAPAPPYLRGVSTGPLAPLVVAASVAGGALALGLSYRTTAFSREIVDNIAGTLVRRLEDLS